MGQEEGKRGEAEGTGGERKDRLMQNGKYSRNTHRYIMFMFRRKFYFIIIWR